MNVTLIVVEGPQKGKKFEFCEPDNFLLGRDNAGSNPPLCQDRCRIPL